MSGHDFRALVLALHLKAWRWLHPARHRWMPRSLWWRLAPTIRLVAHAAASLDQSGFQFYNDDGSESTATSVAAEDTNATLDVDTVYHLRIQIDDTASGAENNVNFQLQYNLNSAGWNNVDATSSVVQSAASQLTDGGDTTARLTAPTGGSFISPNSGQDDVDGVGSDVSFADSVHDYVETVYGFQILSGDVVDSDTIQFRAVRTGASLDSFSVTPQATVNEASGTAYSDAVSTTVTATTTAADSLNAADALATSVASTVAAADAHATSDAVATSITSTTTLTDLPYYQVFRRTPQTGAAFDPNSDTPLATYHSSPYVDSGVADGDYDYQVFGYDGSYTSGSEVVQVTVSAAATYSEALSTTATATTTASDSLNAADALSTTATATTTSADAKGVTETLSTTATATTTVVDSRLSNEAVSTAITSTTTLTDSLSSSLSESLSTTVTSTVFTADALAAADALATTVASTTTTMDSLASSEAVSTSITSTTAITDTLARAYTESLSTTITATTAAVESATYAAQSRGGVLEAIGLETWWAFGEDSASPSAIFVFDDANNGAATSDLTINNDPVPVADGGPISGKDAYVTFNGTDNFGDTVNDSSMLLSTYSIEAWFRIDSAVSGDGNIISASGGTGAFTAAYALWYDFSAGTLKLTVTDLTRIVFTPNLDQWYHVVVTVEDVGGGVSERRVYIDTVEEDAYNFDDTLDASDGVVEVGRYAPGSSNYWHGDISEIAYFDVVLTPEDVERLFVAEYWSEALATSITATTTATDTQTGSFVESLTTTVTSTTVAADSLTAAEAVETAITATTSSQDALGAADGLSTAITLSSEASDVAAMAESVASALSATTTLSDTLTGAVLEELATTISSTTTASDTAGFVDTASITVTATTTSDDIYTPADVAAYEEALATSITSTTSTADLATLTDSLAVTMVLTTAIADRRNKQPYTSGVSKATGAGRATDTAGGGTNGPSDAVGGQRGSRVRAT